MRVTRIYTGPDGKSHFEELEVPMRSTDVGHMSALIPGNGVFFREPAGSGSSDVMDFHVAPRRQLVVHLQGEVEIETGHGVTRRFGVGDVLLADDTTGQGHISRGVGGPRAQVFIPVSPDVDLSSWRLA